MKINQLIHKFLLFVYGYENGARILVIRQGSCKVFTVKTN